MTARDDITDQPSASDDRGRASRPSRKRRIRAARLPVIIDAVAVPVLSSVKAKPEPEARAHSAPVDLDEAEAGRKAKEARARNPSAAGRIARAGMLLDRHAFAIASLTLSLGIGWLIGANTLGDNASIRQVALGLEKVGGHVEQLATRIADTTRDREIEVLKQNVQALKSALDVTRIRTADAVGQVKEKLARAQLGPAEQFQTVLRRLDQVEKRVDQQVAAAVGSTPAPEEVASNFKTAPETDVTFASRRERLAVLTPMPPILPALLPPSARAAIPPEGYVLRDVRDGIAYIESRDGLRTAEPGQTLPGAGRVKSIEKRGHNWVVVTANGVIDSDLY